MEQLIPKLRFPEFSGEWEKKRLGDVLTYQKGFAFKSIDYLSRGIRIIRVSDLGKSTILDNSDNKFVNISFFNTHSKYRIDKGNIIITTVGSKPEQKESAVGRAIYISADHNILLNQNLVLLKSKNTINSYFLYCNFLLHKYSTYIKGIHRGNANQSNITIVDLLGFKITIPSLPEQQKIADYLSTIDKKLELLREKREQLECYKKGMMQQLFSQQIRFKDDSGKNYPDWQEKKLGEILYKGSSVKCTNIDETKILTVRLHQKGVVKSTNTQNLSIGSTTYFVRKKGQFIYGKQNIFNGAFGIIPNYYDGFLTSADIPALTIKKECLDAFFFVAFLRSYNRYKRIENIAIGTGSKRVHENEFLKLKINLPSLPEQQKIAEFLSTLDTKIEGIANQIEQTEAFKKAMLQQLFV